MWSVPWARCRSPRCGTCRSWPSRRGPPRNPVGVGKKDRNFRNAISLQGKLDDKTITNDLCTSNNYAARLRLQWHPWSLCQKCHKITDCHSIPKIPSAPRPPPYLNPPDFQPRVLTGAVEDHVGCRARTEKDERASGNVGKLRTEVEDLEQYGARVLLGSPADVYTSWRGEIVSWSLSAWTLETSRRRCHCHAGRRASGDISMKTVEIFLK